MTDRKIFGLVGRTLGHSWSPDIHARFGLENYRLIELEPDALPAFLSRPDLGGVNVTIPYKKSVLSLCAGIDPDVRAIGSANTLVRRPDGTLYVWNTDAGGFRFMARRAGISLSGRKVLILGSGGASLTVQAAARSAGAAEVTVISRSGPDHYGTLSRHADAEVIVNATPVGMYPGNGAAPVDLRVFPACRGVLDLIYNPLATALILQARTLGIPCSNGLPMLVEQARLAQEHFRDTVIPPDRTEQVLRELQAQHTNLVLIGMPGCGKSTVGQILARRTGRTLIDIDRQVADRCGCSIEALFAREGEAAFRALEREAIADAGRQTGVIIATGGGAVKDPRNDAPLRQNGRVYQLRRRTELLATQGRPLSQGADLSALEREREPLYARVRDAAVDNNRPAEETAAAVWRDFCEHTGS